MKFRYKNEAAFSKALVKYLREQGCFVQRIETAETGRGVPDIYCILPTGEPVWLELKREHVEIAGMPTPVNIHWRVGQQSWMYVAMHKYKQDCYTLACFDDVILQIPHDKLYEDNMVLPMKVERLYSFRDLF